MKPRWPTVLAALSLVALAGCGSKTTATRTVAATAALPYSFALPADWQIGPAPPSPAAGAQTTRIFTGPKISGNHPIVAVSITRLSTTATPTDLLRGARLAAASHRNLAASLSPTTVAGAPAYTYQAFDTTKAGLPLWGEEIIALHPPGTFNIVAFAPRSNYAGTRSALKAMLASWHWR